MVILLTSCYKDLGHYEYTDLDLSISGIDELYVVQALEQLTIEPVINTANEENSDLEYVWYMYTQEQTDNADTLSTERNLDVSIGLEGDYNAVLKVTSIQTGVSYRYDFDISVVGELSDGLVILSDVDNKANISFVSITGDVYQDVYHSVNWEYAGENPVCLSETRIVSRRDVYSLVILCDDEQGGTIVSRKDFVKTMPYSEMFWLSTPFPQPRGHFKFSQGQSFALITSSGIHGKNFNTMPPVRLGEATAADRDIFPYLFVRDSESGFVYDNKDNTFISLSAYPIGSNVVNPKPTNTFFDPANVGLQMIYGGNGQNGEGYGVFADTESGKYYVLTFNHFSGIAPLTKKQITSATDIDQASSFTVSSIYSQLFYSVGNKIYMLNAEYDVTELVHELPADYHIDYIEMSSDSKQLYVGASKAGSGKTGGVFIIDVALNGQMTLAHSYENIAGHVKDFLLKD